MDSGSNSLQSSSGGDQAQQQQLVDVLMAYVEFDDMPALQEMSDSSDEDYDTDGESDRDANEVVMHAVDDDDGNGDDIPPLVDNSGVFASPAPPYSSSPNPSINTPLGTPHRSGSNRRARVEDDEDEDRDRRHPSQRMSSVSATPTAQTVPVPQNHPQASASASSSPTPGPVPGPTAQPRPNIFQRTFSAPYRNLTGNGNNTPFRFFQHLRFGSNNGSANNSNNNSGPVNNALPNANNTPGAETQVPQLPQPQPQQQQPNGTGTNNNAGRLPQPMFEGVALSFEIGPRFTLTPRTAGQPGTVPNANAQAQTPPVPGAPGTGGLPFAAAGPGAGPGVPINITLGNLAGFLGMPFGLGLAGVGGFGAEQEKEDPERAKKLVEGLEDVPVGLIRRLERVGGSGGGMGEDEQKGGDGGCAICWDRLLPDEKTQDQDENLEVADGFEALPSSSEQDVIETKEAGPEPNLPRVVSLPCAHVFHADCLIPWFSRPRHTTCPTCRFNIDPDNLTYVSARRRQRQRQEREGLEANGGAEGEEAIHGGDYDGDTVLLPPTTLPEQRGTPQMGDGGGFGALLRVLNQRALNQPSNGQPFNMQTSIPAQQSAQTEQNQPTATGPVPDPVPTPAQAATPGQTQGQHPMQNPNLDSNAFVHHLVSMILSQNGAGFAAGGNGPNGGPPAGPPGDAPGQAQGAARMPWRVFIEPALLLRPPIPGAGGGVNLNAEPGHGHGQPHDVANGVNNDVDGNGAQNDNTNTNAQEERRQHQPGNHADIVRFTLDMVFDASLPREAGAGEPPAPTQAPAQEAHAPVPAPSQPRAASPTGDQAPRMLDTEEILRLIEQDDEDERVEREEMDQFQVMVDQFIGRNPANANTNDVANDTTTPNDNATVPPPHVHTQRQGPAPPAPSNAQPNQHPPGFMPIGGVQVASGRSIAEVMNQMFAGLQQQMLANAQPQTPGQAQQPQQPPPAGQMDDGQRTQPATPVEGETAADHVQPPPQQPGQPQAQQPLPQQTAPMPFNPFEALFGLPPRQAQPSTPKGPWSLPSAPGPTLRQRIERREREAGLRCYDVSCGLGPSDEDPFSADVDEALAGMQQFSIRRKGGEELCEHKFHSACLVSAERVALQGADAIVDENGSVEVSCPVCRGVGCVSKEEWDEGVKALA